MQVFFRFAGIVQCSKMQQCFHGGRHRRDGRFKLVGHVVDEIVLNVGELFLPEYGAQHEHEAA
ncbi:hypothetical protein D3C86_2253420 [compost metagenome]